jgi:hypothetical protein
MPESGNFNPFVYILNSYFDNHVISVFRLEQIIYTLILEASEEQQLY